MSLKRNLILIIITLMLFMLFITSCKTAVISQSTKVGVSTSDNIGMTAKIIEDLSTKLTADGKSFTALNAEGDATTQAEQILGFIDEAYSVIVICPVDPEAVASSIELAATSEIPVVVFEKNVDNPNVSFFAGYDAFAQGKMAADAMIEADDGKENIVIEIIGPKDNINAAALSKGFHDSIDTKSNLKVIQLNSNWNVQSTYEGIKSIMRKTPTVAAIFSSNSRLEEAIDIGLNEMGLLNPVSSDTHIFRVSAGGSKTGYDSAVAGNVDLLLVTGVDEISANLYTAIETLTSKDELPSTSFITQTYPLGQTQVEINKENIWGFTTGIK